MTSQATKVLWAWALHTGRSEDLLAARQSELRKDPGYDRAALELLAAQENAGELVAALATVDQGALLAMCEPELVCVRCRTEWVCNNTGGRQLCVDCLYEEWEAKSLDEPGWLADVMDRNDRMDLYHY